MRVRCCSARHRSACNPVSAIILHKLVKWCDYALARIRARRSAAVCLERQPIHRVLVVCYGNIYRSPFVEACLKSACTMAHFVDIRSAGFHPREGREVEPAFRGIAATFNVDLAMHRSRCIDRDDLEWAELIVIMDGHNYRLMYQHYRPYLAKCIWLGAVSTATPIIIRDPYRQPQQMQLRIARQLHAACAALGDRLRQAAAAA